MKIGQLTGAFGIFNGVQGKTDDHQSAGGHSQPGYAGSQSSQQQRERKPESQPEAPLESFTDQQLIDAISEFQADPQTQATGLSAAVAGKGPELRVILTEASGKVIRQLTGLEFLRIRRGTSKDQRGRGKILDQKF